MENHDLRWRDFGIKYRGKLKRDGSTLIKIMAEDAMLSQTVHPKFIERGN